jgi:cytosine permease
VRHALMYAYGGASCTVTHFTSASSVTGKTFPLEVPMGSTNEHDDYALSRVPQDKRYHWFSIAVQRFGMLSSLASFLIGATLGFGMSFWNAVLAITLGAVILEILTIFTGIAGQREGLSTSVLARWTGFGRAGSSVIGLAISISAIGWFGIQNAVSAQGLTNLIGVLPLWGWALVFGLAVTAIVVFGFEKMAWTAYITVPAFLVLAGWSIVIEAWWPGPCPARSSTTSSSCVLTPVCLQASA